MVGLYARPLFVQTVKKFKFNITVISTENEQSINARRALEVSALRADYGDEMVIQGGDSDKNAILELSNLLDKFGEEEG